MKRNEIPESLVYVPSPAACKVALNEYCLHTNADMLKPPHPQFVVEQFLNEIVRLQVLHTRQELRTSASQALRPLPRVPKFLLPPHRSIVSFDVQAVVSQDKARFLPIEL